MRYEPCELIMDCQVTSIENDVVYCSGVYSNDYRRVFNMDIPLEKFECAVSAGTNFTLDTSSGKISVSKEEVWIAEELEKARIEGEKLYKLFGKPKQD